MPTLRPIILSGGAGTRLWPVSTRETPKQFVELIGEPLFDRALRRLAGVPGAGPPIVVTGEPHLPHVSAAIERVEIEPYLQVVEPVGRNTAPAVVAAALGLDSDEVMVVLPADHLIREEGLFEEAVARAVSLAEQGYLVTFGITPDRPETGYGYIEPGEPLAEGSVVARFKEKPDSEEARRLVSEGRHLWNSGMFVFTAGSFLREAGRHVPDLVEGVRAALPENTDRIRHLGARFANVQAISIDHAVMEHTDKAAVVPLDAGWSDIGSWQSLWEISTQDADGNVLIGNVTAIDVTGSLIRSSSRLVSVAGVKDVVVVETSEAVLVVGRESAQLVRDLASAASDD